MPNGENKAYVPIIPPHVWEMLSQPDVVWQDGGWMINGTLFHYYVHYPDDIATWCLWDGRSQDPEPGPNPDRPFYMPNESWQLIEGGALIETWNVIQKDGELWQTVAVHAGEDLLALVTEF